MFYKIKDILVKNQHIISYLFFGVLTTLVNYAVYLPLYNWAHFSASLSNIISWAVAVIFAFLTNKPFVFKSNDWSVKQIFSEFPKFVLCRVGSGLLETIILWITVDLLSYNGNIIKIIVSILVVILNYISSKWIVFNKH